MCNAIALLHFAIKTRARRHQEGERRTGERGEGREREGFEVTNRNRGAACGRRISGSFRLVPARPSVRTHRPPCASGEERHRDVRNNGDDVAPRLRRPSCPSPALGRGSLVAIGAAHTPQPRVETCERRGLKSANKI
ncbi:unnamed protein product [Lampetra fluviatilis]